MCAIFWQFLVIYQPINLNIEQQPFQLPFLSLLHLLLPIDVDTNPIHLPLSSSSSSSAPVFMELVFPGPHNSTNKNKLGIKLR